MKIERFAGHHQAREALVLSIAGVTTIMLIANLILMIFYCVGAAQKHDGPFASQAWCVSVQHHCHRVALELPNSFRAARSVLSKFYYD
jgi:hypothetical protein